MKKEIGFATYYRVLGMACILLCHFVQESSNPYPYISWTNCAQNRLASFAAGLQGSVVGVQGGEQTWFISALLLCYLITPMIHSLTTSNRNQKLLGIIFCVLPVVFAVVPANWVSTLFAPICLYSLAYITGRNAVRIPVAKKHIPLSACVMCAMFAIRLGARIVCDGTLLYDKIIVFYTQSIAAAAIFYMVAAFTKSRTPGKVMTYLSSISFEIYLFHYMFCVGPVRVFGLTGNWCVNCVIVLTVTAMIAAVMHAIANKVMRK